MQMTPCVRTWPGTRVASQGGSMRSPRVLIALLLLLGSAGFSFAASTAADLCGANADPCTIGKTTKANDGSVFDLGNRALVLDSGVRLDASPGSMTIIAKSVKLKQNARLVARGGHITVTTTSGIELGGNTRIDV